MRLFLLACLGLSLAVASAACTPKPVSDSEFRGFCYTSGGGRHASCDSISLCNVYDSDALSIQHPSRQACDTACDRVANQLGADNQFNGCMPVVATGAAWCHKYCSSNYPQ
jgi:hypothetical protein